MCITGEVSTALRASLSPFYRLEVVRLPLQMRVGVLEGCNRNICLLANDFHPLVGHTLFSL